MDHDEVCCGIVDIIDYRTRALVREQPDPRAPRGDAVSPV